MILIDGYEIDVAVTETHGFESEVTEHPVESGADIADHVRARPIVVTLDSVVSDTPIGDLAARRSTDTLPSREALARLLAIRDAREPITIETDLRVYDNMVMESLSIPRSVQTGDALRFSATFKQIQLVTNARTTVPVAIPRAKKKVDRGNKPTDPNAPPPPEEDSSALLDAADWLKNSLD